ncbi:7818_t:CDS:1 [Dentiscutata erythropus]|uniref:7818_t:CDS:1 n=1 Tax=Dentiscutata erythropus TaxID=1348616 RepID=A0A9N9CC77_9GLOM|nr:7818_t:CDS:1 [Dentiscutata erythropus]
MDFQENELIPIKKLINNLENENENESLKTQVILLSCGFYYPIHKLHIKIFEDAKQHLEKERNYKIVLGYLSPSPEKSVNKKHSNKTITFDDRINMIKRVTNESPWIELTTLESENDIDVPDHHQIIKNLSTFLNEDEQVKKALKGRKLKLIYLFGLDQALKEERNGLKHLKDYEIVVIERYLDSEIKNEHGGESFKVELNDMYKDEWKIPENNIIFIKSNNNNEISSSKIRELFNNNDDKWKDLCHPKVVEYIETKKIKF